MRMSVYLWVAYTVFCGVPLAMAVSIELRRWKELYHIRSLQKQSGERVEFENQENPNTPTLTHPPSDETA
jgi:hypothetical protein